MAVVVTTRKRIIQIGLSCLKRLASIALMALYAPPAGAQAAPPTAESSSPSPLARVPGRAESPPSTAPPSSPSPLPPTPAAASSSTLPWHRGVPEDRKRKAQALFDEARQLHRRMMLAEARAKYEQALAVWEHPELRLYLGRALASIGLPLLAYDNLRMSLQWGPGLLDPDAEQEARTTMRALVEQELAAIEIRCDEPGAAVLLDGKPWFVGPGTRRRMVMQGEHVVTARKIGYFTVVKPIVVLAGKEASGQLALSVDTVVTTQRWPVWIPWATFGAGIALGAVGAGLEWDARTDHAATTDRLNRECNPPCKPLRDDEYDASVIEERFAIGALIAGGATAMTGTVLVFMNRPMSYRTEDRGGVKLEVHPAVSFDAAILSARLVF
ncbi:hypothetical protein WME90_17575 [Sorangium sp. So ce375]|uniref:hypothetical protein n=1 Tax=Sorangium sp. So ce375 TaxID=3133306 RepID=UPI003F5C5820